MINIIHFVIAAIVCASVLQAQPAIDKLQFFNSGGEVQDAFFDIYLTTEDDYLVCGGAGNVPCRVKVV